MTWGIFLATIIYPILCELENQGNAVANETAALIITASFLATIIRNAIRKWRKGNQGSARKLFALAAILTCGLLLEYIPRRALYEAGFRKREYLKPGICLLTRSLSPQASHREKVTHFDWTWTTPLLTNYDHHFHDNNVVYNDLSGLRRCKHLRSLEIIWQGDLSAFPPMPELRKLTVHSSSHPSATSARKLYTSIHQDSEIVLYSYRQHMGSYYRIRSGRLIEARLHHPFPDLANFPPLDHLTSLILHVEEARAQEVIADLHPHLPKQFETIPLTSSHKAGGHRREGTYHIKEKRIDWLPKSRWEPAPPSQRVDELPRLRR